MWIRNIKSLQSPESVINFNCLGVTVSYQIPVLYFKGNWLSVYKSKAIPNHSLDSPHIIFLRSRET